MLTTAVEHHAILDSVHWLTEADGARADWLTVDTQGLVSADVLRAALAQDPDTVAAVIMEGVVGANGVFTPPAGYWKKIRAICDRHGVLLIADEVLSGFGRTGRWFAVDHDGVAPDMITMAKGLTGGYAPGGAVMVSGRAKPAVGGIVGSSTDFTT